MDDQGGKGGGEALRLSIWDLGGQEQFYALHILFLSRLGVYACFFDMRRLVASAQPDDRRSCLTFLRFWMQIVWGCTSGMGGRGGAPVLLCGTHKDEVPTVEDHEAISDLLYEEFGGTPVFNSSVQPHREGTVKSGSGLLWFFPIDNTKGQDDKDIVSVMKTIQECVQGEDYIRKKVPFTWMAVIDAFQASKEQTMELKDVEKLAADKGLGKDPVISLEDETQLMLDHLSGLGIIMYHPEGALKHLVVLNPVEFLIAPFAMVVCDFKVHRVPEHEQVRRSFPREWTRLTKNGVLNKRLLPILWKRFPNSKELEILAVKYGIIVPLLVPEAKGGDKAAGEAEYLVPSILRQDALEPPRQALQLTAFIVMATRDTLERDWGGSVKVENVVNEGFYPMGLFSRLMGKAVAWDQIVSERATSDVGHLRVGEALLSFGAHIFRLSLAEKQGSIQVSIHVGNPLEIMFTLHRLCLEVLSECAPGLSCSVAVPVDGGRGGDYLGYEGELVLLHGPDGLENAVESGQGMKVGGLMQTEGALRGKFDPWLVPKNLRDWYHLFVSYRQGGLDSTLTLALFHVLTRSLDGASGAVRVFLDIRRLENGRNFRKDFASALINSWVAVPVVSSSAMTRMKGLTADGDFVDNVLLEWTLIVELLEVGGSGKGRLSRCLPLMMGPEQEAEGAGGKLAGDLFASGYDRNLPDVVCSAVVEEAAVLLRAHGIEPSGQLKTRTVRETVKQLLLSAGIKAWDVGSSHIKTLDGGSSHGAAGWSATHSVQHWKDEVVRRCRDEVVRCVHKVGEEPQRKNEMPAERSAFDKAAADKAAADKADSGQRKSSERGMSFTELYALEEGPMVPRRGSMPLDDSCTNPEYVERSIVLATASSEYSSDYCAGNVLNGIFGQDGGADWSTSGEGVGAWIKLDFEHPTEVSLLKFAGRIRDDKFRRVVLLFSDSSAQELELLDNSLMNVYALESTITEYVRIEVLSVWDTDHRINRGAQGIELWGLTRSLK